MSRCVRSLLAVLTIVLGGGCDSPSGPNAGNRVETESSAAITKSIGPEGGTIQATGSNGITYTLEVPENAFVAKTAITLTPVREIKGLPLSGGLVGAVDFKPSGLSFINPATLIIATTARPTGDLEMVGLSYAGNGDSLGLALIEVSASEVRFTVTHFSGLGLGFGTTQDVQSLIITNLVNPASSLSYINALAAARLQNPRDAAVELQVMEDWFDNVVLVALSNASTDAQLAQAIDEFSAWADAKKSLDSLIATPTLTTREDLWSKQELGPKLGQAITGNLQLCATQGTIASARIAALDNAIFWTLVGKIYSAGPASSFPDETEFAGVSCARVITSSVVPPPNPMQIGFPHSLDITFALEFEGDPTPVPANFVVTVLANNATVGTPEGFTALSPPGFFTTIVTAQSSSVSLAATACYKGPLFFDVGLCHTETIFGTGGAGPPPPPPTVGDKYVGTRRFQGTSTPFDAALIFNAARDTAVYCFSPSASNTPDQNRRACATLGGPFTDQSGYFLFAVTFAGTSFSGSSVPQSPVQGQISGQINGNDLTGRIDSPGNLFQTFTMTRR